MTKAEQEWSLIEALEYCKKKRSFNKSCAGCPYAGLGCGIDAVIEKLKAQEPMLVKYTTSTIRCPKCNKQITSRGSIHNEIKFCWKCGQAVKWE